MGQADNCEAPHGNTPTGGCDEPRAHKVCSTVPPSTAAEPPVLAIILRLRRALLASELTPEVNARPGGQDDGGGGGWLSCGVARSVMRTPVALRRLARLEGERHKGMYAGAAMPRSRQKSRKRAADGEKHATHLMEGGKGVGGVGVVGWRGGEVCWWM